MLRNKSKEEMIGDDAGWLKVIKGNAFDEGGHSADVLHLIVSSQPEDFDGGAAPDPDTEDEEWRVHCTCIGFLDEEWNVPCN